MQNRSLMLVCLPFLAAAAMAGDRDWANFRGPDVTGKVPGTLFSNKSQVALKETWRTKIGSGYAGVVAQDNVVITAQQDGDRDILAAFDAATGKRIWKLDLEETYKGHDGSHDGPLMTPTIHGDMVFALSAKGRFVAANLSDGKLVWEANLVEDYQSAKPHYGFTSSPVVRDGVLVMQLGAPEAAVAGFDPKTGKKLWAVGTDNVDYQSPVPFNTTTGEHILAAGRQKLMGVDAKTGKLLYEYKHEGSGGPGMMSIVPIVTGKDRVFLAHKESGSCSLSITPDGDGFKVEKQWDERSIRNSYNVPIFHDGHLYAYSSRFLTSVDAATGKANWKAREPGDGFMSLVDGHLVIATKEGGLHIVKATPDKYQHVAGIELFENLCWNSAAISNGVIYIRSLDELVRVDVSDSAANVVAKAAPTQQTQFNSFLNQVADADDKQAAVDAFMKNVKQTPLIEGKELVHFLYQGDAKDAAVGCELFGARQERAMTQVEGTNLWYLSVPVESDLRANYVLLTDYQTGIDERNDRTCKTVMYGPEMEMNFRSPMEMSWFAMPDWQEPTYLTDAGTKGKIDKHKLETEKMGNIDLEVYLPPGYPQAGMRYPVAYVHGGRGAKTMGKLTTALDNMSGKQMQPVIVVLFDASSRGRTEAYGEMVATEMVALIDKNYPTIATKNGRANIGQGFAGMDAIYTGVAHNDVFGKIGTQSAFAFGKSPVFDKAIEDAAGKPIEIYAEWSKYDLRNPHEAWDLAQTNRDLAEQLRKAGFSPKGGEVHLGTGWPNWSTRFHALFGSLFPIEEKAAS